MRRKALLVLAAAVLLGAAAWAICGLVSSIQDRSEQDTIFERLRKISTEDVPTDLGFYSSGNEDSSYTESSTASAAEPEAYSNVAPEEIQGHNIFILQEENPDCVGWVTIQGTDIDYPVMYSPDDPEYYLDHSFEKTQNRHGVPFLDSRCNVETCDNLLIYGHHFVEGEMFSTLHKYTSYSFYEDHPVITLETAEGISEYKIAAVLKASGTATSARWSIFNSLYMDEEAFAEMVSELESQALYTTGVTPVFGDHLLTLATCEYSQKNGRLAVVAVKEQ